MKETNKLYLLFRTDDVLRELVAAHESLETIKRFLARNRDVAEPQRLGQGWEIDLVTYDGSGKADSIVTGKHIKELESCGPDDIREGVCYNIMYKNPDTRNCRRAGETKRTGRTKCVRTCPPEYIFGNDPDTGLCLCYDDIVVITACREDEDGEDWDRFQYYSHLYQWKKEHENGEG